MKPPQDLMKPWTIKSVPTRVIDDVTAEARRENFTVGQLLERVWDQHKAQGSPQQVRDIIPELTLLLHAAAAMASAGKLPQEVRSLISDMARAARGKPGRQPGLTAFSQAEAPPAIASERVRDAN